MSETKRVGMVGALIAALGIMAGSLFVASCESGDSDDGPDGRSTVQGTVISFSGGSAFFVPSEPPGLLARALDLFIPRAMAAVAGVHVRIRGTDLQTTTDDDGFFIISGVPNGTQTIDFSLGTSSASLNVNVPDNATVTLNGVRVSGSSASSGGVTTDLNENANDNGDDNSNGNDNEDDNSNENGNENDDNSNDNDDNSNENGNDNDDDNENDND